MKVVIVPGGRGTRISSVASDIPKPMIKIENMPELEREIDCLREQGFTDLIITVSYLGHIIMNYFSDASGTSLVARKLLGAGGSFLLFYVQPEKQSAVRDAMKDLM